MPQVPHLPSIAYRDHIPMMKDLDALREGDDAMPVRWQIVSKRKPPEEFYDNRTDPHETRNLIDDAKHKQRIADMRAALERWTADTNDLGLIQPESKMVRERLWPPDGIQPRTSTPIPVLTGGVLTIACDTEGASIGYRKRGEASWSVYTAPVEVDPSAAYEIVAQRIGFKRSPTIELATER
jgi:hypothetical protein